MAYENINLRHANMTFVDGYFYTFDHLWDVLLQRLDDGGTAFSYPLNTVLSVEIQSLEHDGVNFWTMEDISGGVDIKRWRIENSIVELKDTISLTPSFSSDTFTVEHYHTSLAATASGGSISIQTNGYETTIISGTILTLGPNSLRQQEDVTVTAISGTDITLVSGTQYAYSTDDDIQFYNNLWVFNSTGDGTLHKINARTGANITTYSGTEYDNITSCTFARVSNVASSTVDALIYSKSTNLKYLNIGSMSFYGTMGMDNEETNSNPIPIYDIALSSHNIYRLQNKANYYDTDINWSNYNYVLSTVRRFIDDVAITSADPSILPNNAVNVSEITVVVTDQYSDGIENKPVTFTDTDSVGFITINPAYTDYFFGTGEAISYYKVGIVVATVTITATATQYD